MTCDIDDRLSRAYRERCILMVALAKMSLHCGMKAGVGKDDNETWDDEWRTVLYADTPMGQVSIHPGPENLDLLEGLPQYDGKWDGTFRSRTGEGIIDGV